MERELLKGSTPTLVLALLTRQPMHGYQLAKTMEEASTGLLTLKEGTLYPLLHSLERDGYITAHWVTEGGRERKVYQMTDSGHGELKRRVETWARFRSAVDQVLHKEVPHLAHG